MAADALQHGRELRVRFLALAEQGRHLRDQQRRVVDTVREQQRAGRPGESKPEAPRRIEVAEWLRTLSGEDRVAQKTGETR